MLSLVCVFFNKEAPLIKFSFIPIIFISGLISCADLSDLEFEGSNTDKIVNGTLYDGHPAAVRVVRGNSGACTGTLVHPKVVITAKHCIEDHSIEEIFIENAQLEKLARTVKIFTTEGTYWGANHKDFASLVLDREVPITPAVWVKSLPNVEIGTNVLAVGYGSTDIIEGGAGIKRKGDAQITGIYDHSFATTPIGCYGDSGGPIFLPDGRVWGVLAYFEFTGSSDEIVSLGSKTYANCRLVNSLYARTDFHANLIEQAIQLAEGGGESSGDGGDLEPPRQFKAEKSGQRVVLTWQAPRGDFESFELQHEKRKNGEWKNSEFKEVSKQKTRLRFKASTGMHRYRLRAVGLKGTSAWTPWEKVKI